VRPVDEAKVLICVGKNVKDERGRVLKEGNIAMTLLVTR
jgi:hypothetical protein